MKRVDTQKGKWLYNTSCDNPACGSSDGNAVYDDGHSYCFACSTHVPSYVSLKDTSNLSSLKKYKGYIRGDTKDTMEYREHRSITKETMEAYGVSAKVGSNGTIVSFSIPFGSSTQIREPKGKGQKENLYTIGSSDDIQLHGQDKFSAGSAKAITVTEGAWDAHSVYQILGSKYPAVSVRSAATARRDCERARAYLNSFDAIYLCFDGDEPGQRAAKEVATLFDVNKVFHVQLTKHKDANDYLQAGDTKEFYNVWWNAKKLRPVQVKAEWADVDQIFETIDVQALAEYPFPTLQRMSYGIRTGELVLVSAPQKIGKTEFLRALEHHLLKSTDHNIGCIHLEEKEKRFLQGIAGYELNAPCHLPDSGVSAEDQKKAYRGATKRDGRLHFYSHFGTDDPDVILDSVRYMAAVGKCKVIFLDNLTMLFKADGSETEKQQIDFLTKSLSRMALDLDFCLFLVTHVNDEGQIYGSRLPAKICNMHINLNRDKEHILPEERNKMQITMKDNRFGHETGPAGVLLFDPSTYVLIEQKPEYSFEVKP